MSRVPTLDKKVALSVKMCEPGTAVSLSALSLALASCGGEPVVADDVVLG